MTVAMTTPTKDTSKADRDFVARLAERNPELNAIVSLDPESVFPRTGIARGQREMTIPELQALIEELKSQNQPYHNPVMEIQKKFSIPVACFVFALLGVGLGVSNRKDGRLASFVLGIAVIFVYYVVMFSAEAMTKGGIIPAWWAATPASRPARNGP